MPAMRSGTKGHATADGDAGATALKDDAPAFLIKAICAS